MHTVAAAGLAIAGRRGQPRDRGGMSGQRRRGLSAQQGRHSATMLSERSRTQVTHARFYEMSRRGRSTDKK